MKTVDQSNHFSSNLFLNPFHTLSITTKLGTNKRLFDSTTHKIMTICSAAKIKHFDFKV